MTPTEAAQQEREEIVAWLEAKAEYFMMRQSLYHCNAGAEIKVAAEYIQNGAHKEQ